jgi:streptogramin lyase
MKAKPLLYKHATRAPFACQHEKWLVLLLLALSSLSLRAQPVPYIFTTIAGTSGVAGTNNGAGTNASFNQPNGLAVDLNTNIYVADTGNNTIRKIDAHGNVTTLAGLAGMTGTNNGSGSNALFNIPLKVAVDSSGNIYVADAANNTVRYVSPMGAVTTPAFNYLHDSPENTEPCPPGGAPANAFYYPTGIAVDVSNNVIVANGGSYDYGLYEQIEGGGCSELGIDVIYTVRKILTNLNVETLGYSSQLIAGGEIDYNLGGVAIGAAGAVYSADYNGTGAIVNVTNTNGFDFAVFAGSTSSFGSSDGTGGNARFNEPQDVTADGSGNLYVADTGNSTIRMITPAGVVTTIGGVAGGAGDVDSPYTTARFNSPTGIASDSKGNIYIADTGNNTIRKGVPVPIAIYTEPSPLNLEEGVGYSAIFSVQVISSNALPYFCQWYQNGQPLGGATNLTLMMTDLQTTNAGSYMLIATNLYGSATSSVATLTIASYTFNTLVTGVSPVSMVIDSNGNVFFTDYSRDVIWKFDPGAGNGLTAFAGLNGAGGTNDGVGQAALFNEPYGLVMDAGTNLYVTDSGNNTIRMITPGGVVSTIAGVPGVAGWRDDAASLARFNQPTGLAIDGHTNLYVADYGNGAVRKMTNGPSGWQVSTLASGFNQPYGLALDSAANIYLCDSANDVIRFITPTGSVSTLAGVQGTTGSTDLTVSQAEFDYPRGITLDSSGNVFVADANNQTIRLISGQLVATIGGLPGNYNYANGTGSNALFRNPLGLTLDKLGNLYVADYANGAIRVGSLPVAAGTPPGIVVPPGNQTNVATYGPVSFGVEATGSPTLGYQWSSNGVTITNATVSTFSLTPAQSTNVGTYSVAIGVSITNGFGSPATATATLTVQPAYAITTPTSGYGHPLGVAVDTIGSVYFTDNSSDVIWKFAPGSGDTHIALAGLSGAAGTNDGVGEAALFNGPYGLVMDNGSNLYVADSGNNTIRMITPGAVVSTIAGVPGVAGFRDNPGGAAWFNNPAGLAIDSHTNLYVADYNNGAIRKLTNAPAGGWQVITLATGFSSPSGVAVDASNNVYVADSGHDVIQMITPGGTASIIAGQTGRTGWVDGLWSDAQFDFPQGILVDPSGNVIVADSQHQMLRIITATAPRTVMTVAGDNIYSDQDDTGSAAWFRNPVGLALDNQGNLYIADANNGAIREHVVAVPPTGDAPTITDAPQNQTNVATYGPVSFGVEAIGSPTLGYLWSSNGVSITNATASTFSLTPAQSTNVGTYSVAIGVTVTNGIAPPAAASATLTVQPAYAITTPTSGYNHPLGVAVDPFGDIYFTDNGSDVIWKFAPGSGDTHLAFAGLSGATGTNDGVGEAALFNGPYGLVMDNGSNLYVADSGNNTIRMITPGAVVSTIAGVPGVAGFRDNPGGAAWFNNPAGLAIDSHTNLYVADYNNGAIRKLTNAPAGGWQVTTLATGFSDPSGVAVDASNNVYVADSGHDVIQMISPGGTASVIAGQAGRTGWIDGLWSDAQFNFPQGILVDPFGNVIVADTSHQMLRIITPTAPRTVMTVAGDNIYSDQDGTGSAAWFRNPVGLALDSQGNLYIADANNGAIREHVVAVPPTGDTPSISDGPQSQTVVATYGPVSFGVEATGSPTLTYQWNTNGAAITGATNSSYTIGTVQLTNAATYTVTVASTGASGTATSSGAALTVLPAYTISTLVGGYDNPAGVAADSAGNVYFSDAGHEIIVKIASGTSNGVTFAGGFNASGTNNGTNTGARFSSPSGMAADAGGNVYVADSGNNSIRMITPAAVVSTIAGIPKSPGWYDGAGSVALFNDPTGLAMDKNTNLYVADYNNGAIRKVTNGPSGWQVTTLATGFSEPYGVTVDGSNNVYVADSGHDVIQMISPGGTTTIIAGQIGRTGWVDGLWSDAQFDFPEGVLADAAGNVIVADTGHQILRIITATTPRTVMTVAGDNIYSDQDGTGSAAWFRNPVALALDSQTNLYIADYSNGALRKRQFPATAGSPIITTQPQSVDVPQADNFTLTVVAGGTPAVTYQWIKNGQAISNQTTSTFSVTNAVRTNSGTYYVVVSNTVNVVPSSNAVVDVLVPPIFESLQILPSNGGVKFTFHDSDGGVPENLNQLELQWRTNLDEEAWQAITNGFSISGTNVIVTDPAATNGEDRFYRILEY